MTRGPAPNHLHGGWATVGESDHFPADSGLSPDQHVVSGTPLEELTALMAQLDLQLSQIEAEEADPARSRVLLKAVVTGRSVLAQWNALKEHLPRTVDDRTTQRVNSLMAPLVCYARSFTS